MSVKTLNIKGKLVSLEKPLVMGIINVTPDSFYAGSRKQSERSVSRRIEEILEEGGTFVDLGGYSSRPGALDISEEEEWKRLEPALKILNIHYPQVAISVDTFRAAIARRVVEEYGVAIINDISGGAMDENMFKTVASLNVPYILMHMRGTPRTMQKHAHYDNLPEEIMLYFAEKIRALRLMGVNDVIIDPGFGFSKTLCQNYELMRLLKEFLRLFECPLLAGLSRKSMIYKLLGSTAEESLNGTTVLNTYALLNGVNILRVHDVKAAVETVKITERLKY